jgi:hypothetical protein
MITRVAKEVACYTVVAPKTQIHVEEDLPKYIVRWDGYIDSSPTNGTFTSSDRARAENFARDLSWWYGE